jgi:hypothetical protein
VLLFFIVAACSTLSKCTSDLCLLLARGLEDPFPDAKKAAAAGLAVLAQKLPQGALEDSAERLVQVCAVLRCGRSCGGFQGVCPLERALAVQGSLLAHVTGEELQGPGLFAY